MSRRLPKVIEARMCAVFDTRFDESDKPLTHDEPVRPCGRPTCWCRPSPSVSISHPDRRGRRANKLIANFGNGVDNIDVASALDRSYHRHEHARVLTEATADMTMALILGASPRRRRERHSRRHFGGLVADLDAAPSDHRREARHGRRGCGRPWRRMPEGFNGRSTFRDRRQGSPIFEEPVEPTCRESLDRDAGAGRRSCSIQLPRARRPLHFSPPTGASSSPRHSDRHRAPRRRSSTRTRWCACLKRSDGRPATASTSSTWTRRLSKVAEAGQGEFVAAAASIGSATIDHPAWICGRKK